MVALCRVYTSATCCAQQAARNTQLVAGNKQLAARNMMLVARKLWPKNEIQKGGCIT